MTQPVSDGDGTHSADRYRPAREIRGATNSAQPARANNGPLWTIATLGMLIGLLGWSPMLLGAWHPDTPAPDAAHHHPGMTDAPGHGHDHGALGHPDHGTPIGMHAPHRGPHGAPPAPPHGAPQPPPPHHGRPPRNQSAPIPPHARPGNPPHGAPPARPEQLRPHEPNGRPGPPALPAPRAEEPQFAQPERGDGDGDREHREALVERIERLERLLLEALERNAMMREQVGELSEQYARLRRENAEIRERLEQLQRMMRRDAEERATEAAPPRDVEGTLAEAAELAEVCIHQLRESFEAGHHIEAAIATLGDRGARMINALRVQRDLGRLRPYGRMWLALLLFHTSDNRDDAMHIAEQTMREVDGPFGGIAMAHMRMELGQHEAAVRALNLAAERSGDEVHTRILMARANANLARGYESAALEDLNRLVEREPDNMDALAMRARAYRMARQQDRAMADLLAVIEHAPQHAEAHLELAQIHAELGRLEDALRSAQRSLELRPEHTESMIIAAAMLLRLERMDAADEMARRAWRQSEHWQAALLCGYVAREGERWGAAIEWFSMALRRAPEHRRASIEVMIANARAALAEAERNGE